MASNFDKIIFIVTMIGVAKKAQIIHQNWVQKSKAKTKTIWLILSLSHIIFGSTKFPVTIWGTYIENSIKNEDQILSKTTKEYKKGSQSAIKAQTIGIKSITKTISQKVKAKSSQKKLIIIVATTPLNKAKKNFVEKYKFKSELTFS